jgi:hypothetical protein
MTAPRSLAEARINILSDIYLEARKYGTEVEVGPGSADWLFATAHGQQIMLGFADAEAMRDETLKRVWKTFLRLPDVPPSPAAGKIVIKTTGSVGIPSGQQFIYNGVYGVVSGNYPSVSIGAEIDGIATEYGEHTNAPPGTKVRFINPPTNLNEYAEISLSKPFTGGYETEDEPRLRKRVLNEIAYTPGAGNPGHQRKIAFEATPAVQDAFVFAALGGPATDKLVVVKRFNRDFYDWSREVPNATLNMVRTAVLREHSHSLRIVTQSGKDEPADVALKLRIPDSLLLGGDGNGWIDPAPWPTLPSGNGVSITAVSGTRIITVDAVTATAPLAGRTNIAWWSSGDMKFHRALVSSVSGTAGAWVLTLNAPLVDAKGGTPQVGDWICPACAHLDVYATLWIDMMERLGTGQNTALAELLQFAARQPIADALNAPMSIDDATLKVFTVSRSEVTNVSIGYASLTTPSVPSAVSEQPNVLAPSRFGVFPQ